MVETSVSVEQLKIKELMSLGLTDRQANVVCSIAMEHSHLDKRERMNSIRHGLFEHYTYTMSSDIWDKCRNYLRDNP